MSKTSTKPKSRKATKTKTQDQKTLKKYHSQKTPRTAFDLLHEMEEELKRENRDKRIIKLCSEINELLKKD